MDISNIVKVYSGRRGCMCGCLGKYSYTADGATNYGPGYDVSDSVNERSVRIIAGKVLKNPNAVFEGDYAFVEDCDRDRMQMVVFKETAQC
jgi:hypothetical protein